MKIKVCGMRDTANIQSLSTLDIDMMGYIFYPKSSRFVSDIIPQTRMLNGKIKTVGVFVDDMPQNIITRVYHYNLDYIQLHGDESRIECENLRTTIDPDIKPNLKIIKAISISNADDIDKCKEYEGAVDMFLFDTKSASIGGSGTQFDWSVLDKYNGNTPFLLSGGIGLEDVSRIKSIKHPMFAGVDVNSKFEISPALKDIEKVKSFVNQIRE